MKLLRSEVYTGGADYEEFRSGWEKFKEEAKEEKEWPVLDAWASLCIDNEGLPFAYPKIYQFLYALFYYDPLKNKNRGGWRSKDRAAALVRLWKKTTGYNKEIKMV